MDFNFVQVNIIQDLGDVCCPFCSITMENNQEAKMKHLRKYHRALANPEIQSSFYHLVPNVDLHG